MGALAEEAKRLLMILVEPLKSIALVLLHTPLVTMPLLVLLHQEFIALILCDGVV